MKNLYLSKIPSKMVFIFCGASKIDILNIFEILADEIFFEIKGHEAEKLHQK